jgi:hypothetical protein
MTGFGQLDLWRLAGQRSYESGGAGPPPGDLRGYLASLEHETLVDLLCDQAAQDDALHRTLSLRAARDREFAGYLDQVKAAHRRKRNFMAALAARGM